MHDRGTLITGAGIVLAFLVAGGAFLFLRSTESAQRRAEEARFEAEAQRTEAQRLEDLDEWTRPKRPPGDALRDGVNSLLQRQSEDGAWRSDTYATFKSGTALTPLVITALQETGQPQSTEAIRRGCDYLAKLVKADGSIEGANGDLDYPVYTAALSVVALSHPEQKRHIAARDAWLRFLLSHQLTESLGWKPEDKPYGGWGYCRLIPKKPEPGAIAPPLVESNLSATLFALDALKSAGVTDKAAHEKAGRFVRSCQNFHAPQAADAPPPPRHLDGGFYFIYDDPVRNKAGLHLRPMTEFRRFNSYGSATADGYRALLLCGGPYPDQLEAAKHWLQAQFRPDIHPAVYQLGQEPNRHAVYFYYAASVSKALRAAGVSEAGRTPWAPALAAQLVNFQEPDGSWVNPLDLVRENEPLVATANAVIALANCEAAGKK